jgi:RNA methyltransferase, TrmH family
MLVKQKLKYIQTLGQKKFRQEQHVFIAEGPKLVKELLTTKGVVVKEVFGLKDWIAQHEKIVTKVPFEEVAEFELEKISQLSTPNQVLAIVQQFENSPPVDTKDKIMLALDNIQDPGNLGTIIRIADWFGVTDIVCSDDCTDMYSSKVVQSTMGSIARVKVCYTDLAKWLSAQGGQRIYATTLEGQDITTTKKIKEGIIIIGNESRGISDAIMKLANVKITIPKRGEAESLNAAVAAGIILSHL